MGAHRDELCNTPRPFRPPGLSPLASLAGSAPFCSTLWRAEICNPNRRQRERRRRRTSQAPCPLLRQQDSCGAGSRCGVGDPERRRRQIRLMTKAASPGQEGKRQIRTPVRGGTAPFLSATRWDLLPCIVHDLAMNPPFV